MTENDPSQLDVVQQVQKGKGRSYLVWISLGVFLVLLAIGVLLVWVFCGGLEEWQGKDSDIPKSSVSLLFGIPDCVAVVGRLFSYRVPDSAFQGAILSMQTRRIGSSTLPPWLYFDEVSFTFLGVPTPEDLGAYMIEVDAFSSTQTSASTSFLLQVKQANQEADNKLYTTDSQKNIVCDWDEQIIKTSVLLDTDMNTLTPVDRVSLLNKWSDHLSLSINALTLGPKPEGIFDKLSDRKILIAGPGDASPLSSNKGVELTWVIACGEFHQHQEIESILTRNIERGYMKQVLGFEVIGWYVSETLPIGGKVRSLRKKRQAQGYQTPLVTPTVSTTKPTALPTFSQVTVQPTISVSFPVSSSVFMSSTPPNVTTPSSVPTMTTTSTVMTSIYITEPMTSLDGQTTAVSNGTTVGVSVTEEMSTGTPPLPTDLSSTEGIHTSPTTVVTSVSEVTTTTTTTLTEVTESVNVTTEAVVQTTNQTEALTTHTGLTNVSTTTQPITNMTSVGEKKTSPELTTEIPANVTDVTDGINDTTLTRVTTDMTTGTPRNVTEVTESSTNATVTVATAEPINATGTTYSTLTQTTTSAMISVNATDVTNATIFTNTTTTAMPLINATDLTSSVSISSSPTTQIATNVTFVTDTVTDVTTMSSNLTTISSNLTTIHLPTNMTTETSTSGSVFTTASPTNVTEAIGNTTMVSSETTELPVSVTHTGSNAATNVDNITTPAVTLEITTELSIVNVTTPVSNITTEEPDITTVTTKETVNITTAQTTGEVTTVSSNLTYSVTTVTSTVVENNSTLSGPTTQPISITTQPVIEGNSTVSAPTTQPISITTQLVTEDNSTVSAPTTQPIPNTTQLVTEDNSTVSAPTTQPIPNTTQLVTEDNNSTVSASTTQPIPSTTQPESPTTQPLTTQAGIAPCVNTTIEYIQTYLGVHFDYLVPGYTFLDEVYGNTKNLSLHLDRVNPDNTVSVISPHYWVQFDQISQVIYGLPLQLDFSTSDIHKVMLKATNPRDLSTNLTIVMNISGNNVENISFVFSVEILLDTLTLDNNVSIPYTTDDVIYIVNTIGQYYGDQDATWVTLIDIINNDDVSVTLKWTNSSISKTECQNETILDLYARISEAGQFIELVKYLMPQYSVESTSIQWMAVCEAQEPGGGGNQESSTDLTVFLAVFIPILIVVIIIIIIVCVFCCLRNKGGGKAGRYIPDDEKPIYSKNRKPIFMEGELEMDDPKKPRKPTIMESDHEVPFAYSNPSYSGPLTRSAPPPYASNPELSRPGSSRGIQAYSEEEPVAYGGEIEMPQDSGSQDRRPPPVYRLPPPYIESPGYSQI